MTTAATPSPASSGTDRPPPAVIDDGRVPADLLLGPGAIHLLRTAWQAVGADVETTRPTGVGYHAGRSAVVEHLSTVRRPDGTLTEEPMVLAVGLTPPPGALVVADGVHEAVVWRVPADPWLPGLGPALDRATVAALLEDLGLPSRDLTCHVRAYRPTRRAVVEVTGPEVRLFLKVVPVGKAEALHQRHVALRRTAPVPLSHGWSPELGIVVLQALPGRPVRDVLLSDGALPAPGALLALLDSLPDPTGPVRGHGWRSQEFATHIGAIEPDLAPRTDALAEALAPFEAEVAATPSEAVHGDLYDSQVLVDDDGRISGLLDVDTFRTGHRVEDLATYLGHLAVLSLVAPAAAGRIDGHARTVLARFDAVSDPAPLRAAVAGVVLGLATGSFRTQDAGWREHTERRVALAERWLDSAIRARPR